MSKGSKDRTTDHMAYDKGFDGIAWKSSDKVPKKDIPAYLESIGDSCLVSARKWEEGVIRR